MKNPDVNGLSPGGWCRCAGEKVYGCESSCDAPLYLVYEFKRPKSQRIDLPNGEHVTTPTYNFWDCWNGEGKIYFRRVDSTKTPGTAYPNGPYDILGCQDMKIAYRYQATWYDNNGNPPGNYILADLFLLCDARSDGMSLRKQQRLVLYWYLPDIGPCYDCGAYTYGAANPEDPFTFPCPDLAPPYLLYESSPKWTVEEAVNARIPCLKFCDTVFHYVRKEDIDEEDLSTAGETLDEITTSDDDTMDGHAHNTELLNRLFELKNTCGFCHCSELATYKNYDSSKSKYCNSPASVTFSLSGFPSNFIVQMGSTQYDEFDYSALNGTHTTTSNYICSGSYSIMLPLTVRTYRCIDNSVQLYTTGTYFTSWSFALQRCIPTGSGYHTSCRKITCTWGDQISVGDWATFHWGDDVADCGHGSHFDYMSPGYADTATCGGISGGPVGYTTILSDIAMSILASGASISITSLNP